jgi:hypothetical protein
VNGLELLELVAVYLPAGFLLDLYVHATIVQWRRVRGR